MSDHIDLSVLLPVYRGDDPVTLRAAIESVLEQSRPPDELVIVRDGPLSQPLDSVIDDVRRDASVPVKRVTLSENLGLGGALREGLKRCRGEFTARMDADDLSVPRRFELQTSYLERHPDLDLLGGYIAEFDEDPEDPLAIREVPTEHDEIADMARFRSPFNHATVVMRTEAALAAGNYRAVNYMEDWDLWSRMLLDGARSSNLPEVLLQVRAGEAMYGRRGGIGYTRAEFGRQTEFLRRGFVTPGQYLRNLVVRVPVRVVPDAVRGAIYRRFLRSHQE